MHPSDNLALQYRNTDGVRELAIMHYQPVTIQAKVGERTYDFTYRHHVAMAWVREEDVGHILDITKTCCGGSRRRIFQICNKQQVNIWTTGDPRKDWNENV